MKRVHAREQRRASQRLRLPPGPKRSAAPARLRDGPVRGRQRRLSTFVSTPAATPPAVSCPYCIIFPPFSSRPAPAVPPTATRPRECAPHGGTHARHRDEAT